MEELPIFTAALGISAPWYIKRVYFEEIDNCHRLFIEVAHKRRTKFEYDGVSYPVSPRATPFYSSPHRLLTFAKN
jgi:hypothetical protein